MVRNLVLLLTLAACGCAVNVKKGASIEVHRTVYVEPRPQGE